MKNIICLTFQRPIASQARFACSPKFTRNLRATIGRVCDKQEQRRNDEKDEIKASRKNFTSPQHNLWRLIVPLCGGVFFIIAISQSGACAFANFGEPQGSRTP